MDAEFAPLCQHRFEVDAVGEVVDLVHHDEELPVPFFPPEGREVDFRKNERSKHLRRPLADEAFGNPAEQDFLPVHDAIEAEMPMLREELPEAWAQQFLNLVQGMREVPRALLGLQILEILLIEILDEGILASTHQLLRVLVTGKDLVDMQNARMLFELKHSVGGTAKDMGGFRSPSPT